jgi:hypothetical protein
MRSPIRPKNKAKESVPDEHNLSTIAKSNSAIPRPTFFNVVFLFKIIYSLSYYTFPNLGSQSAHIQRVFSMHRKK